MRTVGGIGEPTELAACPEGNCVAVATHDLRLLLVDPWKGSVRVLDTCDVDGGIFDLAWSADGRWLAYAASTSNNARTSAIRVCKASGGSGVVALTDGAYRDTSPSFDPAGKFVAFLSSRCLRAAEDEVFWGLSFPRAQRPHLCMLTDDARDPLRPPPRPPGWQPEDDEPSDEEDDEPPPVPPVRVQAAGIERRVVAVPAPPGRMSKVAALYDDTLVFTQLASAEGDGRRAEPEEEEAGAMVRYALGSGQRTELMQDVLHFTLSADLQA